MYRLLYVFLVLVVLGCGDKQPKQEQDISLKETQKDSTLLEPKDLKNLSFTDYVLDRKIKNKLSGWTKYNEVNDIANEVKKADLSYFKSDKKIVETTIKELMETIPENIDTESVKARILAVQNMYLRLNNVVNLNTSSKAEIKKAITNFLEAFSNLNFQINKKFERDAQNIIKP